MALELYHPSQRTIGRALTLVVISLLAVLFRYLGPLPGMASGTMLLGFLLLAAFVAGELAADIKLPRITGYLVIGIAFGPWALGLLPEETVKDFRLINDVALSVIALQAGGELRLSGLYERWRSIVSITSLHILIIMGAVATAVYLGRGLFPFLAGQTGGAAVAVALILGLVAVAKSPATTIAVITEQRARGPLTETVLGVSVFKDVVILLLIAVVISGAEALIAPGQAIEFHELRRFSGAIAISLGMGGVVGWLIGLYLERIGRQPILFVLFVAFAVVELTRLLGFESEFYILLSMAAGFVVQNFSVQGPRFVDALEANSLPLYALFFSVAGANLNLGVIPLVWKAVALILVVRTIATFASTYLGATAAGATHFVRRYSWMGFLAQAGVTLGLATIVEQRFDIWGSQVAAIIIAMIAVNQLVGPPLFRLAIVRSGESN
jgi:Kef-type K+ transport system membrane component KefB